MDTSPIETDYLVVGAGAASIGLMAGTVQPHETHKLALLGKLRATMIAAVAKLRALMAGMG